MKPIVPAGRNVADLDERIAELERANEELAADALLINESQQQRIAELEAENQRLRELAQLAVNERDLPIGRSALNDLAKFLGENNESI